MKNKDRIRVRELAESKQQARISTKHINPQVAQQEKITFSFINLDLKRGLFACSNGHGAQLINVLENFRKHSGYNLIELGSRKNCHKIPDDQIKRSHLEDLKAKANAKLMQIGSQQQAERIIGYFESTKSNLFQVCLLDLTHQLSS